MKTPDWMNNLKISWGWATGLFAAVGALLALIQGLREDWALGFVIFGGLGLGIAIYFLGFVLLAKRPRQVLLTGGVPGIAPRYETKWRRWAGGGLVSIFTGIVLLFGFPDTRAYITDAVVGTSQQPQPSQLEEDMVLIPAGIFTMGSEASFADPNTAPEKSVFLDNYWMDIYEVSNLDYQVFVINGHPAPTDWSGTDFPIGQGNNPVVFVSWYDARDYCFSVGKRLPSEAEWEKAARGSDERSWPWGNTPQAQNANTGEPGGAGHVLSVDSLEAEGQSPYGVVNMAGNVWEWVDDWYEVDAYLTGVDRNPVSPPFGKTKVMRGGSWTDTLQLMYTFYRLGVFPPDYFSAVVGFRCACTDCRK